ncbi:NigD-like protein [Dysgonomonas alginatilytica]|uniref:NigD-like protein n=1 Tax=Dysgonomonas alginatilytica TaxID=1605892 RepID=A0A2V3PJZ6_9BACT|nr:NigD-like protein [Dysgonomonas alginatilytica]PXV58119.1 NigD-like protein [Dysgonomonas alginatilytica]
MKTIRYSLIFLVGLLTTFAFSSCTNDDGYSLDKYMVEIATVNSIDSTAGTYYLTLDNGETLWPVSSAPHFVPKSNQRVLVNFTLLSDKIGEYDHYARINQIQNILTKNVVDLTSENEKEIGNDPIKLLSLWTGDNYLNIRFGYNTGGEISHSINLVRNKLDEAPISKDGAIILEFRHNKNGDPERYGVNSYVAFDLRPFKAENKDSIKFIIKVLDFGNATKEYPITYKY